MQNHEKPAILVADDEAALREALVFDFQRRGFTVLQAPNGRQAFELVKQNKIDVILSDVRMPNGDGIELLDNVKTLHPKLPVVIFITAYADLSIEESYHKDADAIFSKSFDRKALFSAVMNATLKKERLWSFQSREQTQGDFKIKSHFQDWNLAIAEKFLNFGHGGFFFALDDAFPTVDTEIAFTIVFETGPVKSVVGNGIVRWVRTTGIQDRPSGCGIEFKFLSDESRSQVIKFIDDLTTKSFIPIS